jgi:DNA polymerase-3 subunit alpha
MNATKRSTGHPKLFKTKHREFVLPKLEHSWLEDAYDQMELLGFPLYNYYDLIAEELKSTLTAKDMPNNRNRTILMYGILVNTRFHTTTQGKQMRFCTFTDLEGNYFDTVHFPQVVDKYPIHGRGIYACYGKVTEEFGHYGIDIVWSKKMPIKPDPRSPEEPTFQRNPFVKNAKHKQIQT